MFDISIFDNLGRIASYDCIGGNIFYDYTSGCDDGSLSYVDISGDEYTIAEPYVITDGYSLVVEGVVVGDSITGVIIMVLSDYHTFYSGMEIVSEINGAIALYSHAIEITVISKMYLSHESALASHVWC